VLYLLLILYRQQILEPTRGKQTEAKHLEKHIWQEQKKFWLKLAVYEKRRKNIQLILRSYKDFAKKKK
jgi:hypothetical protein